MHVVFGANVHCSVIQLYNAEHRLGEILAN
jgi:hypothetical protein